MQALLFFFVWAAVALVWIRSLTTKIVWPCLSVRALTLIWTFLRVYFWIWNFITRTLNYSVNLLFCHDSFFLSKVKKRPTSSSESWGSKRIEFPHLFKRLQCLQWSEWIQLMLKSLFKHTYLRNIQCLYYPTILIIAYCKAIHTTLVMLYRYARAWFLLRLWIFRCF